MSLRTKLQGDIRDAMRARDEVKRDTLRMVVASVQQAEIDLDREMKDDEVLKVLATARKTRVEAAEQFDAAGRADLAQIERAQLEVVVSYLPRQLGADELRTVVQELVVELGVSSPQDKGQVMKALMGRHKGLIDGKAAQQILGELLP